MERARGQGPRNDTISYLRPDSLFHVAGLFGGEKDTLSSVYLQIAEAGWQSIFLYGLSQRRKVLAKGGPKRLISISGHPSQGLRPTFTLQGQLRTGATY